MDRYHRLIHENKPVHGLLGAQRLAKKIRSRELLADVQSSELTLDQKVDIIIKVLRLVAEDK